jgi:hypothetical protein
MLGTRVRKPLARGSLTIGFRVRGKPPNLQIASKNHEITIRGGRLGLLKR